MIYSAFLLRWFSLEQYASRFLSVSGARVLGLIGFWVLGERRGLIMGLRVLLILLGELFKVRVTCCGLACLGICGDPGCRC